MSQENNFVPEQKEYKKLRPFPLFMKNNFPFIENTFEALDYYGLLCEVVKFLNDIIENEHIVMDNQQAVYDAFIELNSYVSNYFDNLDVQEEINNKLDDMVEAGTLQEIVADYLNSKAVFGYDTVDDMKSATNLIDGSYAKTLGFYAKNDGGSATYKIRNITNDDVIDNMTILSMENDNLIAELVTTDTINIKQLGAYGNQLNDDTAKIQKAIDLFDNIYIPKGTYKITNAISMLTNDRTININGDGQNSILLSTEDTQIFNINSSSTITLQNLVLKQGIEEHTNKLASFIGLNRLYINKVNIMGLDETNSISKPGMLIKNITISTIENCLFSNSFLDIETWDVKISKSWFWSVSQDYCIKMDNVGNINIDDSDFVPPFIDRHSDYIETYNQTSQTWNQIVSQAAILILNTSNGITISNSYIDGNNTTRTGRGIIINNGCFNINIINNRSNLMNDNLITISSSYDINISNNYLLNYANYEDDRVSFVDIFKKSSQSNTGIIVNNNIINANNVQSTTPVPVINENESAGLLSADYNVFMGNPTKDVWSTEINLISYTGYLPMSNNRSTNIKYGTGHQFKSTGSFEITAGNSGKSVTLATYTFPYDLLPQNIQIAPNNRIVGNYRLQKLTNNNQYYIEFSDAMTFDTTFYYTAKL